MALVLLWLVLPVLLIFVISLRQPVFTERYVIWIGPAAILLLALGLKALAQASGRLALPVTALFVLVHVEFLVVRRLPAEDADHQV